MITQENIQFVISIATLLAMIFGVYKLFSDPDVKASEDIAVMKEKFKYLNADIGTIKNNHLAHIEADIKIMSEKVSEIENSQTRILTILEERNK